MQEVWPPAPEGQSTPMAKNPLRTSFVATLSSYCAFIGFTIVIFTHLIDYTGFFCTPNRAIILTLHILRTAGAFHQVIGEGWFSVPQNQCARLK